MFEKLYGSNDLGEQSGSLAEYELDACQLLGLEQAPAVTAYIDTLPQGLIGDEI